ncbi:hypothetical protein EGW08_003876 [Elysia chlorotica]|uniref:Uncharacterized protein n=1 Tax=Elysia chlorotica TaxID=188477 RepID=A0A3S1CBS1_ELYCH|nr:hypothetical protein EGW08_003876 [Elysia chlorotica]
MASCVTVDSAQPYQHCFSRQGNQPDMPHQDRDGEQRECQDHVTTRRDGKTQMVCLDFLGRRHVGGGRNVLVSDHQLACKIRALNDRVKLAIRAVDQGLVGGLNVVQSNSTIQCLSLRDVAEECAELCIDLEKMQKDYSNWKFLLHEDCRTLYTNSHLSASRQKTDLYASISVVLKEAMQYKHRTVGEVLRNSFQESAAELNLEKAKLLVGIHEEMNCLADKLDDFYHVAKNHHNPKAIYAEIVNDIDTAFESINGKLDAFREKFFDKFGEQRKLMSEMRKEQEELHKRVSDKIDKSYEAIARNLKFGGPTLFGLYKPTVFKANK